MAKWCSCSSYQSMFTRLAFSGVQRRVGLRIRVESVSTILHQAFSSTPTRSYDLAKLVLVGRLGKEPELRTTKNDKEYVSSVLLSLPLSPLMLPLDTPLQHPISPLPRRIPTAVCFHPICAHAFTSDTSPSSLGKWRHLAPRRLLQPHSE
jgi:hypothetical protein